MLVLLPNLIQVLFKVKTIQYTEATSHLFPGEQEEVGGGHVVVVPPEDLLGLDLARHAAVRRHQTHDTLVQDSGPVPGGNNGVMRHLVICSSHCTPPHTRHGACVIHA